VARQHLADEKDLIAPVNQRLADELLGRAVAVHFRGVDDRHAEINGHLQRGDFLIALPPCVSNVPGADAEYRHAFAA
jgi:hypothetical protein